jgi:hypothetical protein
MSKVQTVNYKCSTGRDGFFSESLEIGLSTDDNTNFLSADALADMNRLADELRDAVQAKMDSWRPAAPTPRVAQRGTITEQQLEKLAKFDKPWSKPVIAGFCQDEGVSGVSELSTEAGKVLIDELFSQVREFKNKKAGILA